MPGLKGGHESFSDDEFDDLGDLDDLSDEDAGGDLFSDSEYGESEKETDYTYVELQEASGKVANLLKEKFTEDKESLPGTKCNLEELITQFCTITRRLPLEVGFGFLAAIGILSVVPIPEEEQGEAAQQKAAPDSSVATIIDMVATKQTISFTENWKNICTSKKTFDTLANFPIAYQLVLEHIIDTLAQEDEEKNMQLGTKEILQKIVNMSTTTHFIPPEDVTTNLIELELIKLHQLKVHEDKIVFQVEYADKLTKAKSGGMNFWIVLLMLLMLSPALLRKILGFIG